MMNPKSAMKILYKECCIEVNTTFAKKMADPTSGEYALLQSIRRDYPEFTVRTRQIKKKENKDSYKGLNYEYMRNYILLKADPQKRQKYLETFDEMQHLSSCHSVCKRYPVIKKWFLDTFPEVKTFGVKSIEEMQNEFLNTIDQQLSLAA